MRQKPTAHISYHEGLELIRQFLLYASHHTVEEIQAFTGQWVPHPRWVKVDRVTIPEKQISEAADLLIVQLGEHGVNKVGGKQWWQWRYKSQNLEAEWIEMRNDYNLRMRKELDGRRIMLYVHGGAYFFGSTDEHRYQMQRHARKLKARVLAPRYRLAPQFPFPCGLHDCLSAYLYLLTVQNPMDIILAGDSAGAGMVVSLLVTLRDQGVALPAGAILISPWVDLTHSFPSLGGPGEFDYIPAHGFMQRPSPAWPPPNDDEMEGLAERIIAHRASAALPRKSTQVERKNEEEAAVQGFAIYHTHAQDDDKTLNDPTKPAGEKSVVANTIPGSGRQLSIMIDGNLVELKDQIQMYTTNQLISHPLVSPVLQPSLGGLPPLLILTGGGELLRDEQIYLAHKAANPSKYPPSEAYLDEYDPDRTILNQYNPTDVQLQVWDDLCHVAPTLSFTRPAKFMYRSVAQFGAWALARAQKAAIDITDDDQVSVISSGSDTASESEKSAGAQKKKKSVGFSTLQDNEIGKAGDPLPIFQHHMIRQRVNRHGVIFPLPPESELPALQMSPDEVGVIKKGPVSKWMHAKRQWDGKYGAAKRRIQKQRIKDMTAGNEGFGHGEVPPPSALAGRRKGGGLEQPKKPRKSMGLMLWTMWGSHHDEDAVQREEKIEHRGGKGTDTTTVTGNGAGTEPTTTNRPRAKSGAARLVPPGGDGAGEGSRSRSRKRTVTDAGQTGVPDLAAAGIANIDHSPRLNGVSASPTIDQTSPPSTAQSPRGASLEETRSRPTNKFLAVVRPFQKDSSDNASFMTTSTNAAPMSDTASTTAVFAAPGVLGHRTRKGTASTIGSATPSVTEEDGTINNAPETSRRGSLASVDRLRSHQLPPDDESVKSNDAANGGMHRLTAGDRNISSVAVKGVEGVIKPETVDDGVDHQTNGVDTGEVDQGRPSMPARDEFVTAQEL